ncbi:MAG TPA: hypothetical protein VK694_03865 [Verrucomicrobiae bacterium]|nr:hypothetical protein [Verrucomicrobiae bacterium]
MFETPGERKFWAVFVIPMIGVIGAILWSYIIWGLEAAQWVSLLGTPLVLAFAFSYIVFRDSKQRWPGLSARQRAKKVLMFET